MKPLLPVLLLAMAAGAQAQSCGSGGGATVCLTATGTADNVQLSWTAKGNVTGLQVYRDTDSNPDGRIRIANVSNTATAYLDGSAVSGTPYWYWVRFTTPAGSYNSGAATAVRGGTPPIADGRYIMIDQFGYLPNLKKVAVLRDPVVGYDAAEAYTPGTTLQVIDTATQAVVYSGTPTAWNNGATDSASGDRVWHFDFSAVTAPGSYQIVDPQRKARSYPFNINANVYRNVLIQAVRMFYYQRIGQEKSVANAGAKWADGASNLGAGQDPQARRFLDKTNAATARDLRGGWADAGDFNKYTSWAAGYTQELLDAYLQNPTVWTDDFNLPESGNGIPDLLDEAKWGLDWLKRMQNADGSVLSILGLGGASPPSHDTGPSYYGDVNTSATLATAAALAEGAKVFASLNNPAMDAYAADLLARAKNAWNWALANPNVIFYNTDGLGVGQQETDDAGRASLRLLAAIKLFAATGDVTFRNYVDAHYTEARMFANWDLSGFSAGDARNMLFYAGLPGATPSVAADIRTRFLDLWGRSDYDGWGALEAQKDPYRAFIGTYTWASNATKANAGTLFTEEAYYGITRHTADQANNAAADYLHYLHGVNPFGKVYLTNMYAFGAKNSVNQIWHTWFFDGTAWDDAQKSPYGPAPGYLVGGPAGNQWSWDGGCPGVSPQCGSTPPTPPYQQPPQKSYLDFNTGWPLNSWSISEPSNGYQVAYIRLLARFVK
jgi:endoglucanase